MEKLIVHPNKEGTSIANENYAKEIISNKNGGIISYIVCTTNQDKVVSYSYISQWDMWVVPGINKEDYLDDVYNDFLYKIVLVGITLIILQITLSLNINKSIKNGIDSFCNLF
ncbi:MAG: Cache 3/Cache 2 fusion domain-containing protein [Aliarcobacter sp.]|nr:Cache 3/Cache 2 fusion domain-containing protein [Aliarcobacter sp.]